LRRFAAVLKSPVKSKCGGCAVHVYAKPPNTPIRPAGPIEARGRIRRGRTNKTRYRRSSRSQPRRVRQLRITAHLNARKQRPRIGHNLEQSSDCPGPSTRPPELRAGIIPENGPGLSIGSTVDPTIAQVLRPPNAAGRDQDDGRCDEKSCRSRLWWVPTVRVICSWQKGDNLIGRR
jgi:hypothetical protein